MNDNLNSPYLCLTNQSGTTTVNLMFFLPNVQNGTIIYDNITSKDICETDSIKYKSITDENGIPQFEFETVQDARWINTHICKPDGISYVHKDVCTDWSFSVEGIRLLPSMAAMDLNSGVQYRIDRLADENRWCDAGISPNQDRFCDTVIAPSDDLLIMVFVIVVEHHIEIN